MKGLHWHYTEETENILFSVIWAFSEYKFYGLIINKNTYTYLTFLYFLIQIKSLRESRVDNKDDKYCIIYDNPNIHKTKVIKKFAEKNKIKILTIPPYWPVLNAAEKLILSMKKKIQKWNDERRYVYCY